MSLLVVSALLASVLVTLPSMRAIASHFSSILTALSHRKGVTIKVRSSSTLYLPGSDQSFCRTPKRSELLRHQDHAGDAGKNSVGSVSRVRSQRLAVDGRSPRAGNRGT